MISNNKTRWKFLSALFYGVLLFVVLLSCEKSGQDENEQGQENNSGSMTENQIKKLKSLGYVTWTEVEKKDREKAGITLYIPSRASDGVNIFCSENSGKLQFLDMKGDQLHSISLDVSDLDREPELVQTRKTCR